MRKSITVSPKPHASREKGRATPDPSRESDAGTYVKGNPLERMTYRLDADLIQTGKPTRIVLPREHWPDCIEGIAEHLGGDWQDRYPNCTYIEPPETTEEAYMVTFRPRPQRNGR